MVEEKFSFLIPARDNSTKLSNLIISIKKNQQMKNANFYIIDDSTILEERVKNRNLVLNLKENRVMYVDKERWDSIKKIISKELKGKFSVALRKMNLGTKSWNTHNTRNIGQVICALFCDPKEYIISLDEDMVLPKGFHLSIESELEGILLMGCPDLSRLEWIQLYGLLLSEKLQIKVSDFGYTSRLTRKLGNDFIKGVLCRYTNFIEEIPASSVKFPPREEMNNGSFVTLAENISLLKYPSWFDSDWFWFQRIRKGKDYSVKFNRSFVIHDSSRKEVLNQKMLEFEEIGKIITILLKTRSKGEIPSDLEIRKEVKKREKLLNLTLDLFNEVLLFSNQVDQGKIKTIMSSINNLLFFLDKIREPDIIKTIQNYESEDESWVHLIKSICSIKSIKSKLFPIINFKKLVVFSPHCDDVAFSLGGSLINGYLKAPKVYDTYTKTNYFLNKPLTDEIGKERCKEESVALKKFGVILRFMGFSDAPNREYLSEKEYMSPLNNPKKDSSFMRVKNKIYRIVNKEKDKILLFPLGIGYQIDHRILFEIAKELSKKGYFVLFYEDAGYKMTEEDNLVQIYVRENLPKLKSINLPFNNVEEKIRLCGKYKTQISEGIINNIDKITRKRKGERIWGTIETLKTLGL